MCHRCVTKKWRVAIKKRRKTKAKTNANVCPNLSLTNQAMVPNKPNHRHILKVVIGLIRFKQKSFFHGIEAKYSKSSQNNG